MKYLVISDIHGNIEYASKIPNILSIEECDKIILLGDLYYNYSFNKDNVDKSREEVSNILNNLKDKIICIRGNCDTKKDEEVSDFNFNDYYIVNINNKNFFFTHGHIYNEFNIPVGIDILVYGHLHIPFIKEYNNLIVANPGSIASPRNKSDNSYMVIDEENITLKNTKGKILETKKYK